MNLKVDKSRVSIKDEKLLKGIPSSSGVAFGTAFVIKREIFTDTSLKEVRTPEEEIGKFNIVLKEYIEELTKSLTENFETSTKETREILEIFKSFAEDPDFVDEVRDTILSGHSVEYSIENVLDKKKTILLNSKDSRKRERAIDIEHFKQRLLDKLTYKQIDLEAPPNSIIVASSFSPEQVLVFKKKGVVGLVTEIGGISAHSSILVRSLGIPEVIGVSEATSEISTGDEIILDAYRGCIYVNPAKERREHYLELIQKESELREVLYGILSKPTQTLDGKSVLLMVNINTFEDVVNPIASFAAGVGLVRTEHLIELPPWIDGENLSDFEEYQFNTYKQVAEKLYPKPVIFRFFDLGGDKFPGLFKIAEANPMLGFRGIRYLLTNVSFFKTQIRALLRASMFRNIKLMAPMITTIQEIKETISLINECKFELFNSEIDFDHNIQFGVMIETPSAAIQAEEIMKYVDFVSVGTNDLTQYTLAADRENQYVVKYFDPFHPAVLKLIKHTVDSAKKFNKHVGICGELASHPAATALLLGLQFDSISVSIANFAQVKEWISEIDSEKAKKTLNEALEKETYDEVRKTLLIV